MREDRCVDLLRWNDNNFKELGRKLKFKAKIGQKMSLKFNFKTDKIINSLKQAGAEWGQTKCKI